ncbi:protein mono-ADP-ribosyltransferase PARP12-like, partial [Plectropomus leopardus]|uniref:protein mono-ADP-ribosyltransferase PARP12-like n=1 Tax=Plectropomus leopardus TaxID=160734 RepID=UPI001C4B6B65
SGSESWLSREVQLATSILCSSAGSMQLQQLHRQLLQRCNISEEEFSAMVYKCPRFLLVGGPSGDPTVVARTSLRLCGRYGREDAGCCREDCPQLHLCRYFLFGTCRFGKA